jgi:hypothetical protein
MNEIMSFVSYINNRYNTRKLRLFLLFITFPVLMPAIIGTLLVTLTIIEYDINFNLHISNIVELLLSPYMLTRYILEYIGVKSLPILNVASFFLSYSILGMIVSCFIMLVLWRRTT